jgi:glutamine synthetase
MKLGVDVLPKFNRDNTDRNRTSPFAFTGNKFEFRMLGSSNSIACANIMLNSAVAESLKIYADRLENAKDFETALHEMIKKTIKDHKRIIFNGNGYDESWIKEATEKRGLLNYRTTADAIPHLLDKKNVDMLIGHGVFSEAELRSRCEIMLENYNNSVMIEANTMISMVKTDISPAIAAFTGELAKEIKLKSQAGEGISCCYETATLKKLSALNDGIMLKLEVLEKTMVYLKEIDDTIKLGYAIRDSLLCKMNELRVLVDQAEVITSKKYWPYPSYADLLFSVR